MSKLARTPYIAPGSADREGQLAAIKASGRRAQRAIRELAHGADGVVKVGDYVRTIARLEASEGGKFRAALDARPEIEQWGSMSREVFGELYGLGTDDVAEADRGAGTGWMGKLFEEARVLPEWQEAKQRAEGDAWATGLCSAAILEALKYDLPAPDKNAASLSDQEEFLNDVMAEQGMTSPDHLRRLAATRKALAAATAQDASAVEAIGSMASQIRSSLRSALAPVLEEVKQAQQAEKGLGVGQGFGAGLGLKVTGPREEIRAALRTSPKLKRVAKLAGRLRASAAEKQRTKTQFAREEVSDVTAGADLERLLASEMMLAGDPDTEALLFRRLLERSALQYEVRGKERLQEGPIVMALDESGSMNGVPDEWSKACALALIEIAARQNRPFGLVHFDSRVHRVTVVEKPRNGVSIEQLRSMVEHFCGGGTSLAVALNSSLDLVLRLPAGKTLRKADIILVTDGVDYDRDGIAAAMSRASEGGVAVHVLAIGCDVPSYLSAGAATVTKMDRSDLDANTDKVHAIFSI